MVDPVIIIGFAFHSRIDSGHWLLEQCITYNFDGKTNDLRKATLKFICDTVGGRLASHLSIIFMPQ